ncbi:hypothetical protein B296_00041652 [Ensete ventricosum]|uniref:Uncharacterized protein n=1 Tax=Ensete ventricosum TaxID=4639 RepID=A0A426ZI08_ENSVE|nr:hypothetical protein B296_00041652 [Ensete ventricosum]
MESRRDESNRKDSNSSSAFPATALQIELPPISTRSASPPTQTTGTSDKKHRVFVFLPQDVSSSSLIVCPSVDRQPQVWNRARPFAWASHRDSRRRCRFLGIWGVLKHKDGEASHGNQSYQTST